MPHDLRALSREWFDTVWNNRDTAAIGRLASPMLICHGLDEGNDGTPNLETFRLFHRNFLSAFPDIHVNVEDVLLEGDQTAVRLTFTGTHRGSGIGIPPTGNSFTATALVMIRWRDGKIIEGWNEFDAAGMMRQLQAPTARLRG